MEKIPTNLQRFFWDSDLDNIDLRKNADYVIDRLLKMGNVSSWGWLFKVYSLKQIKKRIAKSKQLTAKDINFYSLILN